MAGQCVCFSPARGLEVMISVHANDERTGLAEGYDADVVLFDPTETFVVRAADSFSGQSYTPFEGHELTGRVKTTFVRGHKVYDHGQIVGTPIGRYVKRPTMTPGNSYREAQR